MSNITPESESYRLVAPGRATIRFRHYNKAIDSVYTGIGAINVAFIPFILLHSLKKA
jgi:hypothetical protein